MGKQHNRPAWLPHIIFEGIYVLAPNLTAMVLLEPHAFGAFSVIYLVYVLATSFQLSIISESWARSRQSEKKSLTDSSASFTLTIWSALPFGIIGGFLTFTLFESILSASLFFIAVISQLARASLRYRQVGNREILLVRIIDYSSLVGLIIGSFIVALYQQRINLNTILFVWAIAGICSLIFRRPSLISLRRAIKYWRSSYGKEVKLLFRDSLLGDLDSVGTPYILAPILGLYNFGIFRSLGNSAGPVRLIVVTLRPYLSNLSLTALMSWRNMFLISSFAVISGTIAYFGLALINYFEVELGTFSELTHFAVAVAIVVPVTLLNNLGIVLSRLHLRKQALLTARIVTTITSIVLPTAGACVFSIEGAIWGFTISRTLSWGVWSLALFFAKRKN